MLDEQDLVDRMRRGEQRAFDQFFDAYAARLAAFAARRCSLDAAALEDVVQVTMINAMRGLGTFRGGSALFTWLCQICRNHLADIRRKAERQPKVQSLERARSREAAGHRGGVDGFSRSARGVRRGFDAQRRAARGEPVAGELCAHPRAAFRRRSDGAGDREDAAAVGERRGVATVARAAGFPRELGQ